LQIPWYRLVLGVFFGAFAAWFAVTSFAIFPALWEGSIATFEFLKASQYFAASALLGGPFALAIALVLGVPIALLATRFQWTGYKHAVAGGALVGFIPAVFMFGMDMIEAISRRMRGETPVFGTDKGYFHQALVPEFENIVIFALLGAIGGIVARWVATIRYRPDPAPVSQTDRS
jgi:hypothetical protein